MSVRAIPTSNAVLRDHKGVSKNSNFAERSTELTERGAGRLGIMRIGQLGIQGHIPPKEFEFSQATRTTDNSGVAIRSRKRLLNQTPSQTETKFY
jgi:hypothetical protein